MDDSGVYVSDQSTDGFWSVSKSQTETSKMPCPFVPVHDNVKSWHHPVKPGFYRDINEADDHFDGSNSKKDEEAVVPDLPSPLSDPSSPCIQTASLPPDPLTPTSLSILCQESPGSLYTPVVPFTLPERPNKLLQSHDSDHMGFQGYNSDIYLHRRKIEMKFHPRGSLGIQPQVTESMRGLLVDSLIHTSHKLGLQMETLFLAVNILDRFMLCTKLPCECIQLLGIVSMLIAGKQEEIFPPEIDVLLHTNRASFSRLQVKQMERLILTRLKFEFFAPSSLFFLEYYAANRVFMAGVSSQYTADQARKTRCLARYLLEMTMANYTLYQYPPSVLGLVSLEIADEILGHDTRLGDLYLYGHGADTLALALKEMALLKDYITCNWNSIDLDIVFDKYSDTSRVGEIERCNTSFESMSDAF